MPVSVKKMGSKWRVVGPNGKPETNNANTAVDGGGYDSKQKAVDQVAAININKHKKAALEKLIAGTKQEFLAKAELAPIMICSDGTPEGTCLMINGVEVPYQRLSIYSNLSEDYPNLEISITLEENSGNGVSVTKTMNLRKTPSLDKED